MKQLSFENIEPTQSFIIKTEFGKALFVKTEYHYGDNSICVESQNGTYEKGRGYFRQSNSL